MFSVFCILAPTATVYLFTMFLRALAFEEMMRDIEQEYACNQEGLAEAFDEAMPLLRGE
ncbi:hypothetical protein [Sulfitobacter sp. R18_1]|uniref:hypothetical protein n=1 Tax=Sulfitobacter sp. R18_1 TaxID=2821104 RepID=UPI001ADC1986|nr:hypothetical protein [Sulfitobacter sp. R18_1]MBO9428256.1 hypothetical protein [Sulfitobacter sp. R18_1]